MKAFISFFIILVNSCTMFTQKIPLTQNDFVLTPCSITYKGKPIPLGKPLKEWHEMFGNHDRLSYGFVWDDKGIGIKYTDHDDYIDEFYIFFQNLESPLGQAGKLEFARDYETVESVISRNEKQGYVYNEDEIRKLKDRHSDDLERVQNYFYPFTTYNDVVNLENAAVSKGMSLAAVNAQRDLADIDQIGYWDKDGNWSNDRNSITIKTGEFVDYIEEERCAENKEFYNLITLRYTEGELEYIKVIQKQKDDLYRKVREDN